jgi:hypothetical protein
MARAARSFVLAVVLASAASAQVREFRPVLLRIDAHVGPKRPEDRAIADLTLRRGQSTIELTVTELRVLSGELTSLDLLDEVAPYRPNMSVDGPRSVLERLTTAGPDEPLVILGYFRRGQRILMLSSVERAKTR